MRQNGPVAVLPLRKGADKFKNAAGEERQQGKNRA